MNTDKRIIKSYVWHGEKCFYVSTIERDSSALLGPYRFNETLVWEFDLDKVKRGDLVGQEVSSKGSIREHFAVCERLFKSGNPENETE